MKIKMAIVDNEMEIRSELANLLDFYGIFELVAEFDDVNKANDYLLANEVDVVFINMDVGDPKLSGDGSYLAYNLAANCQDLMIVMYAAKEHPAGEIYQLHGAEFLRIPFEPLAMQRAVQRIRYLHDLLQYKKQSKERSIMIKTNLGYRLVNLEDVLFIERMNRKNRMVTVEGCEIILSGYSLDELEKLLAAYNFYRCYQSFIVNLSKVSFVKVNNETKNYVLTFEGYAGEVSISRDKYNELVNLLREKYANILL